MHPQAALRPLRRPLIPARLLRMASDERLVEEVRAGSQPAFEVLYDRHHRAVLAFCRHMLGSVEEAEDAIQHTFLAAYKDLLRSDKPIALRAWLFAIARNRCLSVLRGRREQPMDEPPELSTEHLSAEVQRREDLRMLLHDLATLPDDQRAALVLAEVGDVSHDEIAQVLDCPREKVKALVFQARTSLNASRAARETPCEEIREQLATSHGGALRRSNLRRHLRDCAGCRAFRDQVGAQRKALALALPVVPTVGLKGAVLASVFGGGGAAAAGGAAAGATAGTATGGATAVGSGAVASSGGAVSGAAAAAGSFVSGVPAALIAKAAIVLAVAGGGAVVTAAVEGPPAPARGAAAHARAAQGSAASAHTRAGQHGPQSATALDHRAPVAATRAGNAGAAAGLSHHHRGAAAHERSNGHGHRHHGGSGGTSSHSHSGAGNANGRGNASPGHGGGTGAGRSGGHGQGAQRSHPAAPGGSGGSGRGHAGSGSASGGSRGTSSPTSGRPSGGSHGPSPSPGAGGVSVPKVKSPKAVPAPPVSIPAAPAASPVAHGHANKGG